MTLEEGRPAHGGVLCHHPWAAKVLTANSYAHEPQPPLLNL